jgi:hypothetical protein
MNGVAAARHSGPGVRLETMEQFFAVVSIFCCYSFDLKMLIVEGKKINDHLPFQPNNKKVFLPIE